MAECFPKLPIKVPTVTVPGTAAPFIIPKEKSSKIELLVYSNNQKKVV